MLTYYNGIFVIDHAKLEASSWNMLLLREIQIISFKPQLDFGLQILFPVIFIVSNISFIFSLIKPKS